MTDAQTFDVYWLGDKKSLPSPWSSVFGNNIQFLSDPTVIFPESFSLIYVSEWPLGEKATNWRNQSLSLFNLVVENWNSLESAHFNAVRPFRVFEKSIDVGALKDIHLTALERLSLMSSENQALEDLKRKNRELQRMTQELESQAQQRTQRLMKSKAEVEEKLAKVRSVVKFVKDLAVMNGIDEMLQLIRMETRKFHRVKEPILAMIGEYQRPTLFFFQGSQCQEKTTEELWPLSPRLRINDRADQTYLAKVFGRPFVKTLAIPLGRREWKPQDPEAVIFFEHSLSPSEVDEFIDFLQVRLQPMSLALDRIQLEQEMKSASLTWERTFDAISDPVSIIDLDFKLLRHNLAFAREIQPFLSEAHESLEKSFSLSEPSHSSLTIGNKFYEVHSYPIRMVGDREATTAVNHYMDVTRARELRSQVVQSEKMVAVGHLAGNIAHELNNPLTGIRSLAQLLLADSPEGSNEKADLVEVEKAAARCQSIIKNLLEFSRNAIEEKVQLVDLNDIVPRTLPLLKTAMRNLNCNVELFPRPLRVLVEPQLMQQVVFNIVNNACQATPASGHIRIATEVDGPWVKLIVSDTGVGIPPENLQKIFDPFFTTKAKGQGTGLGLNMSLNIVRKFGGEIEVKSEVGVGSTFTVQLPRKESMP